MRRIGVVLGVVALMPASLAQAAPAVIGGTLPKVQIWQGPATQSTPSVAGHNASPAGARATVSNHRTDTVHYKPATTTWPSGSASVTLAPATKAASSHAVVALGATRKAGALPVSLAGADTSGGAAKSVSVAFASRQAATAAGVNGVIFTVARSDGGSLPSATQVGLNYAGYDAAYGGGYADRLKLVELPACALTTPQLAKCRVQTPVKFTNDIKTGTLTATVPVGGGAASAQSNVTSGAVSQGSAVVLAQTSSSSGSVGTYSATSLSDAGSWTAGGSSGAFTYSYPITVPPTVGGSAPNVSLAYNSASVDGRTSATNSQASWIGDGWDYSPGYIERSYQPCSQDGITNSSDMCWGGNIVTLSLAGHSGALVRDDGSPNTWHLQNDDGTTVTALSGVNNGVWQGEAWEITTPDGTRYYFGENHLPGGSGSDTATQSAWTEPVYCPKSGDGPTYLSGAPSCYSSSTGTNSFAANMAWRWNLDYAVDAHGNLQTYTWVPETNYYQRGYAQGNGTGTNTIYARGGYLHTISYGSRISDAIAGTKPLDTVTFNTGGRCTPGYANCTYSYLTANLSDSTTTSNWPDTPADQICTSSTSTCSNYGPSFFDTDQLQSITTQVLVGSTYDTVDTYNFSQYFPDPQAGVVTDPTKSYDSPNNPGDGTVAVMWLGSIQHTGNDMLGGATTTAPSTTESFEPNLMQNRVDGTTTGGAALFRPRMDTIDTESGSQIVVSYYVGSSQSCSRVNNVMPSAPDADNMFCFPQYWPGGTNFAPALDWFNIYPVQAVTVSDLVAPAGWSEGQVTSYSYTQPAWHRDDSPLTPGANAATGAPDQHTWNQFHGFRTVTTTAGAAGAEDTPTQTVTTYLQGMDGDYLANGTQRSVSISDSLGDSVTDSEWLQGQVLESDTLLGTSGAVQKKSVNGPWTYATTASQAQANSMPAVVARTLQSSKSRTLQLWHDGSWKTLENDTAYDSSGRLITTDAKGDGTSAVPEVCTTTSYATSTSSTPNMLDYPDEAKAVQGACGTTATAANTVSDKRIYYDGSTSLGTLTGAGDATQTQAVDSYNSSGNPVYVTESQATYDAYGRATSATDADGNKISTAYTAPATSPDTVTVTNPKGWTTTTTLDPARNLATASVDVNGELTSKTYDTLGRVTDVWSPLHAKASNAPADETYSYNVSSTVPSSVTSNKLLENSSYNSTVDIYDGSMRLIQVQAPTADYEAGRLLTDTHYNSLGQSVKTTSAYYDKTTFPTTTIFQPLNNTNDSAIPEETETFYDGIGRTTKVLTVAQGTNQWATTTAYKGVDETDTTPPSGGTATAKFTDALGRITQSWAYTTATPTGNSANATATSYTYTPAGKPATMTDTAGNAWSWTYDLHGNQTKAVDPGTGTSTSTYDANGNPLTTTDARAVTLSYAYDQLGRKTAEYNTSNGAVQTASDELASWTYDSLEKGQLTSSSRYTDGSSDATQTYTEAVTGYTALYQPTGQSVTIPSAEGNLANTYKDALQYTSVTSLLNYQRYYAEGGLGNEGITYGYTFSGLLDGFGGTETYLDTVAYNPYGQVLQTKFGPTGEQFDQTETYDTDTGRLLTSTYALQTSGATNPIDDISYNYNQAGLITSESNLQTGDTTPDTQCFTYDNLNRLTAAYTDTAAVTSSSDSKTAQVFGIGACGDSAPTAGKITGGPAPYAQTYNYDALGDRVGETILNTTTAAASTTKAYAYNGYNATTGANTAATTPDALQSVTSTSSAGTLKVGYGYTTGGGMTASTTATVTGTVTAPANQTLTYDAEGRTQSVKETSGSTSTTSSYLYSADGSLLIQKDQADNQNILYLPYGEEIYLNTGNGTVTGNRFITASPDGVTIVHASSGAITYEAGDTHRTETVAVNASTLAVTNRYCDPFGNTRGTTPNTWPDAHSFLNQPKDATTGLDLLGARQYDPANGRFLTVDPVLESGDQRQMNGYSYGADDPINEADPTGQMPGRGGPPCGSPSDCQTQEQAAQCNGAGNTWINGQCESGGKGGADYSGPGTDSGCDTTVAGCDPTKYDQIGLGLVNVQESDPQYATLLNAYEQALLSTTDKPSYSADQYETLVWMNACETIQNVCGFDIGSLGFSVNQEYAAAWLDHAGSKATAFRPLLVGGLGSPTGIQIAAGIFGTVWSAKGITSYLPKNPLSPAPEEPDLGSPSQITLTEGRYTLTYTVNEDRSVSGDSAPAGYSDPVNREIPMPHGGPSTNPINEWTINGLPKTRGGEIMDSLSDLLDTDWGENGAN